MPISPVEYTFTAADGPMIAWQVRSLDAYEALSEPYQITLVLVSTDLAADAEQLLGCSCELRMDRQAVVRTLRGVVRSVEFLGVDASRLHVRLELVPALRLLEDRVDTRLWQGASVPDVVAEVLGAALGDYERSVDLGGLTRSYAPRVTIVQYHESDLAFVSRLLEEEGISYRFDHEQGEAELMLLEDSNAGVEEVVTINDSAVLLLDASQPELAEFETLQQIELLRELTPTAAYQRVFDWSTPTSALEAVAPAGGEPDDDEFGRRRELYHHGRFVEGDPGPRTLRKLGRRQQLGRRVGGVSNVIGLEPGRRFSAFDAERPELSAEYLIRRVIHAGDCPEVVLQQPGGQPRYQNRFECLIYAAGKPYLPEKRTPRPRVHGPQTAIVTGPAGEEIHTDEYGRVKVRFDWDRQNGLSDDTSMWTRVAHNWAGPGFGTFFVPRIGMEVVVEFLEGRPDQPMVVGCVYNGDNAISVGVPANKTQSTLRTNSSPGGGGYNELRFEDAAGSEEVFIHAQKDFNEVVEHCHSTLVKVDQSNTVGVNQTQMIGANQTQTIGVNQTESVGACQTMSVGATRTKTVGADEMNILKANRTTMVAANETEVVQGRTSVTSVGFHSVSSLSSFSHSVIGKSSLTVTAGETGSGEIAICADDKYELDAVNRIALVQGSGASSFIMEGGDVSFYANGAFSCLADGDLSLSSGNVLSVSGATRVVLNQGGASIDMICDVVTITASEVRLVAGGSSVAVMPGLVEVVSPGPVSVRGSVIKLNC
ncbi:type VI secretion system tip protein VgrG [Pseudenhygromyxa sp. WMMC2535]|uniref:type VI secretion system Vgr family protein n=1 Tax=Pseudenhygromyxa sp. WMMC2535 TaxID=2712867 RepID=UPI00155540BC|nr:type VI secretion system tip protein TssI/VgrG [Pseudenhygromyxa sp. WMMC2535]NVB37689.1 type VI secretion system tip protein VgrG [Pseudenhygromyxa sp. WMMC2535]